jgi:2-haloacid dehalogenase
MPGRGDKRARAGRDRLPELDEPPKAAQAVLAAAGAVAHDPYVNLIREGASAMTIGALVFDAYGTLYDAQSVLEKAEALCPGKGEVITQVWRLKQLEYTWLRSLLQQYEDFWQVTRASLDFALRAAGIEPDEAVRGPLMENYLRLDPYPEASDALARLDRCKLAILSNGSPTMLQNLVRNSGLDRWIEAAISVDSIRQYKPHRSCYALVQPVLGVPKEEVLFVSSNGFDVVGAKAFGFKVAWIRRSGDGAPASMFGMLRGRAEELGHTPDHVLSALTELPALL